MCIFTITSCYSKNISTLIKTPKLCNRPKHYKLFEKQLSTELTGILLATPAQKHSLHTATKEPEEITASKIYSSSKSMFPATPFQPKLGTPKRLNTITAPQTPAFSTPFRHRKLLPRLAGL